jgi:amino acid transporter
LAARYKTTGGSFDFVRIAISERSATVMGILNLLKLVLANAATALAISSYMGAGGYPNSLKILVWLFVYTVFTCLDCIGISHSAKIQFIATALCVSLLLFYSISGFTIFHASNLASSGYTENGILGFLKGLPFSLQFFDGFEEIPLLMGYCKDPDRTMPRGILACYMTVTLLAVLVLVSGAGASSASILLVSEAPLMDGIELVYGTETAISDIVAALIVLGLLVNFFSFLVYSSQQLQSVAITGRLPYFLSYRHPESGSPIAASIFASMVGLILVLIFSLILGEDSAQNTLLTASMVPAILGYVLTFEALIRVRKVENRINDLAKKHMTPSDSEILGVDPPHSLRYIFGVMGARIGQLQCIILLAGMGYLCSESYDFLYGIIVVILIGVFVYAIMIQIMPFGLHDVADVTIDDANDYNSSESVAFLSDDSSKNSSRRGGGVASSDSLGYEVYVAQQTTSFLDSNPLSNRNNDNYHRYR